MAFPANPVAPAAIEKDVGVYTLPLPLMVNDGDNVALLLPDESQRYN